MRDTFTGGREQTTIDVARLENTPEQIDKPSVPDTPPHAFQKPPVMDRIKVARQVTFDDPAALRIGTILKLRLHATNSMMHAAFRPEAMGVAMEIAFPDRLHGHQHCTLNNTVRQGRNTQRSRLAIGFRDIDPFDRLRAIGALHMIGPKIIQMLVQIDLQTSLIHSVNAWRSGTVRRQNNPSGLGKPFPIGNEP